MNILVIPAWYPNGTDKLMGIYHKEFCHALSMRDNINVNMLYIDRQRLNAPIKYLFMKKKEVIQEDGYQVYLRKVLDIHKISDTLEMKKYVNALRKSFKEYIKNNAMPDIIHAEVSIPSGYAACIIGREYNIPVLITEHASYFERFFEGKNKKYMDLIKGYATFSTVSKYMQKIAQKHFPKCEVLPNLVDTDAFKKERKKVNGLKLITVAALRQGKKIDDIIKTLKKIREEEKIDATLTVIGDGFLENYYKEQCKNLNMDEYVFFSGRKSKEEISDILLEHNIYVISSDKETFCIPGIEALASGMPVVSTKCLGPEEYIDDTCGKLVNVGDIEGMKKAIMEVYKNIDDYKIEHLRELADKYSSKSVTDKAIEIYNKMH